MKILCGDPDAPEDVTPIMERELPVEFMLRSGESAKQYRDRVAPHFNEFLVRKAVLEGDSFAMNQFTQLQMKDMDTKVRLAQIVGPGGVKVMLAEGSSSDFKEMAGITGIPAASVGISAGIAAGTVRPSDVARQM